MTDPEILDAEPADARAASDARGGLLDRVLAALQGELPGRVVRVEGATATIAGGQDGDVTVQLTPLFALVGFRGARMAVMAAQPPDALARDAAAKAARFAREELIVYEAQETAGLLRSVILAVRDGRLHGIVDDGQVPTEQPARAGRFYSAQGGWSRLPTREEERWLARESGGWSGKLKRKLIARVFKRVGASLQSSIEGRMDEARRGAAADTGARTLPRGEE